MKILVITGSPRKNGNTNTLVNNFIKGAEENGHTVLRFDSAFKNVHPCIACNKCGHDGDCVFNDDFNYIKENIKDSDIVVFASPMYYYGISTKLKSVIERFYSINKHLHNPKRSALILCYADTAEKEAQPVRSHYAALIKNFGWTSIGEIIASGVWLEGDIIRTQYPKKAYELGKSIL